MIRGASAKATVSRSAAAGATPARPRSAAIPARCTGDRFWLGKLLEHPEIMTQGETIEELEENLKDAFRLMALDEVPKDYRTKEIAL